jgi:DNA-binding FadR family transcriptional regulator
MVTTVRARTLFAPLEAGSRAETVARQLERAIRLGLLLEGERLPPESELAGRLGVSTETLRDALASLRDVGLVETRRGRGGGSFVRAPSGHGELERPLQALSLHELRDVGDHRAAIAAAAARLAAERALPADVEALREHAARLSSAETLTERRRADARLHVEIAAAAQSPRLTREEMALWAQVGDLVWLPLAGADVSAVAAEHDAIVAAIGARDGRAARELAEAHVAAETRRLLELRVSLGDA